jgi:hypothetical protein
MAAWRAKFMDLMMITTQAMYVQRNVEAGSCNHCCSGKSVSIIYSECVSVSLMYPACNACAPYCHLWPCPALQYFSTLSHEWYNFPKNIIKCKMLVLIFCTTFVWNISGSKKKWARHDQKSTSVFTYSTLHVQYPAFLLHFNHIRIFSTDFREILKYHISWKSVQ